MIDQNFGTHRGAVRLLLSYLQVAFGAAAVRMPVPAETTRFVFVCQGNICRSAFAEAVAREAGFNAVSVGLATSTGLPANPPIMAIARDLGFDLQGHRTTSINDYEPLPGDFLLAMEVRQTNRLAQDPRVKDFPRSLLGLWARPYMPHLHDPYELNDAYMRNCLVRIAGAVRSLTAAFPNARIS